MPENPEESDRQCGDGTDRSETKYGDRLEGHNWAEKRRDDGAEEKAKLPPGAVTLEIIHTFDPDESYGFGRRKYELIISPPQKNAVDEWIVSYARFHRWKGNYWRKDGETDWADLPGLVKARAAETLPVNSPSKLDPGHRVIEPDQSTESGGVN